MYLNPAETVIHEFGGVCATARALGLHKTTVSKWRTPRDKRGTGGLIPSNLQRVVLKRAIELGICVTPEDLILGRTYGEAQTG